MGPLALSVCCRFPQSYTGEIFVALTKNDPDAPDIELPCKVAQLIPRQWMNCVGVPVKSFEETSRDEGGFGSTSEMDEIKEEPEDDN